MTMTGSTLTEAEFTAIIARAKPAVLGAIRAHLRPDCLHAIDDIAQESFLRIYCFVTKRGAEALDQTRLGSWAYVIAKNECFRWMRREGRRGNREREAFREGLQGSASRSAANWQGSAVDPIADQQTRLEAEELIQQTPEPYASTLRLLGAGHSLREIAARLGVAEGTVKSRIARGRRLLQAARGRHGEFQ